MNEVDIVRIIHQHSALRGIKAHKIARAILAAKYEGGASGLREAMEKELKSLIDSCKFHGKEPTNEYCQGGIANLRAIRDFMRSYPASGPSAEQGEPEIEVPSIYTVSGHKKEEV